jgi:6-phosphogluconolactonase (cycloisomerase 2 family)
MNPVLLREAASFLTQGNPAEASLAGHKEVGRLLLLLRSGVTQTQPGRCESPKRSYPIGRACFKLWSALAVGLALLGAPLRAGFADVANSDKADLAARRSAKSGVLTPVPGSAFPAGINPASVAVDFVGRFVYVANFGDQNLPSHPGSSVSAFSIGSNGTLTPVPGSPFPAGVGPTSVAVDPVGRFAYVANFDDNTVSAYRIGLDGALTPGTGSPFPTGDRPASVAVDLLGRFVYVANSGSNDVSAYHIHR